MDVVYVSGTVDHDGVFVPGWWRTPEADAGPALQARSVGQSDWAAVALDSGGEIVARAAMALSHPPICPGGSRFRLDALLPLPPRTSAVAIVNGGREVSRREVPLGARVAIGEGIGRRLARRSTEIEVQIDGPEPRPGAFIVAWWEAPGRERLPLGLVNVGSGERSAVRLDLERLPGGDRCRLDVTYGDGIRTTTVVYEPISVEERPATLSIVAPPDGATIRVDGWLSLEGRLDGGGDPSGLEWSIDGETVGAGARSGTAGIAAGSHTVTLRYESASVTRQILVLPAPAEEVEAARWTPPWRAGPFRLVSPEEPAPVSSE